MEDDAASLLAPRYCPRIWPRERSAGSSTFDSRLIAETELVEEAASGESDGNVYGDGPEDPEAISV